MDTLKTRKSIISKIMFALMLLVFISGATGWMVKAEDGGGDGSDVLNKTQILTSRFDEQERLRVIVQLNVPGQTNKTPEFNTPAIHKAQSDLLSTLSSNNVRLIHDYDYIPFMAVEVDRVGMEGLLKSPLVVGVEEDILMKPLLAESVPLINADDVWNIAGYTGEGQVVAVLDTGVDKNHPALAGKVVSEACYSSDDELAGETSLCPGEVTETTSVDSALPYLSGVCPSPLCDHGTHVAGIVAANGTTVKGVAIKSNLIAIQVFTLFIDGSIQSYLTDQLRALQRIYELKDTYDISAVNLSLGGYIDGDCDQYSTSYKLQVDLLRSEGIVTIAASGNEGYATEISYPACITSVVSVGATTKSDLVASYSNSSELLDFLAPGGDIYIGTGINSTLPYGRYGYKSGTSMAAPHVAGAWALIRSAEPEASIDEISSAFKTTGVMITDYRNGIKKPRIDVFAALQSLMQPQPTIPTNIIASDGTDLDKVIISWSASENTDDYKVFRSYRNDSTSATQVGSIEHPSIKYDDTSANPGVKYYYWVKACNAFHCSDFSASDSGWRGTGLSTPTAPIGLSASDGEFENKVKITWYEVGGANYYQVFRNEFNNPNLDSIIADSITNWSYDDLTAERGKEYYYWVKACKTQGQDCSDFSLYDIGYLKEDFNIFLPLVIKNYADVDPILNGDFEDGRDGSWTESSSIGFDLILPQDSLLVPPHSGSWAVWLGGDDYETSRLSQSILISSSRPYLHYWYWIGSEDICDSDFFKLKINSNIVSQTDLCTSTNTSGWVEQVVNLSGYTGSSVTMMFEVINDFALNSNFFLDDVSMSSVSTTSAVIGDEILVLGDVTRNRSK